MRFQPLLFITLTAIAQEATNLDRLIEDFDNPIRAHTLKLMAAKT